MAGVTLRNVPALQPTLRDLLNRMRDAEQDIRDTFADGRFPERALRRRWREATSAYNLAWSDYCAEHAERHALAAE
jgi:hypothetical protein